jgi:hypothetical protein
MATLCVLQPAILQQARTSHNVLPPGAARPLPAALSDSQSGVIQSNKNTPRKTAFIQIYLVERIVTFARACWTHLQTACYIFSPSF